MRREGQDSVGRGGLGRENQEGKRREKMRIEQISENSVLHVVWSNVYTSEVRKGGWTLTSQALDSQETEPCIPVALSPPCWPGPDKTPTKHTHTHTEDE